MTQSNSEQTIRTRREPDYDFLDPKRTKIFRTDSGHLRLMAHDERSYLDVKVVRAFPFSAPSRYITFLDAKDRDSIIGMISDPEDLDEESRRLTYEALGDHYFLPIVTKVYSLREEFGTMYFDIDTDRGRRRFVARGIRDGMEEFESGEVIIPDVDGNRYRVVDWRKLDARSRRILERVL